MLVLLGQGVGKTLALSLAKMGNTVVIWSECEEAVMATAGEIKQFGGKVHPYTVDLSDSKRIESVATQVSS